MIQCNISNPFGDAPVYYVDETDSTMDDLRRLWKDERRSGVVLVTGFQRAGRGRTAARRWVSPPGSGLLFSLVLAAGETSRVGATHGRCAGGDSAAAPRDQAISSDLPLRVGCAVAVVLRRFGLAAAVKWPNDVLAAGRKIAGTLIETVPDGVIIGIGLNCNQTSFPEAIRAKATSLQRETGRFADPLTLLPDILSELRRYIDGSRPAHITPLLSGVGEQVSVRVGESVLFGRLVGVSPAGGLVIRTATGLRTVTSGEIVRIG